MVVFALAEGFFEKKAVMVELEMDFVRDGTAFLDCEVTRVVLEGEVGGVRAAVSELGTAGLRLSPSRQGSSHAGRDRFHPVTDQSPERDNVEAWRLATRTRQHLPFVPV